MSHREKLRKPSGYQSLRSVDGTRKERLAVLEPQEDKDGSLSPNTSRARNPLFAMQESLPILKEMTSKDKLSTYLELSQKANLFERLGQDLTLSGESLSPFWSVYTKEMSDALSALTPIDSSASAFRLLSGSAYRQEQNSWFSMKSVCLQNKNSLKISCPSFIASPLGYTDSESTKSKSSKSFKKKSRNRTKKSTPNSVKRIRVYPSKELHRVWKRWLAAYRWVYNWTVAALKAGEGHSAYYLQALARAADRPEWVKDLPGHQLQEAVSDALDAFWQAKKNNGCAKFKSCQSPTQVIKFKAGNFKHSRWYPKKTGKLELKTSQQWPEQCAYGTQLVYKQGKWFGIFPTVREVIPTSSDGVIALDPGVRTFLTGYDGDSVFEVGQKDIGRINRLCTHLDQLMSKIALSPVKRVRYKMRKAASRLRERIQNLVKDLHNKTARHLLDHYKLILLPTFESSQMVKKQRRKIRSKTARNMLTLKHYSFKQHLKQAAAREGIIVVEVNEAYTSKTCPECGHIHDKLGGSKQFRCPNCGYSAHRDWNGARSIMIRALQATAFTVKGDEILISGFARNGELWEG